VVSLAIGFALTIARRFVLEAVGSSTEGRARTTSPGAAAFTRLWVADQEGAGEPNAKATAARVADFARRPQNVLAHPLRPVIRFDGRPPVE
jgi:hypothetical protein